MAIMTGPIYVPAPNPTVPRYGLFRVATGPLDLPMHARLGGLQYELTTCSLPLGYLVNCQDSHASKTLSASMPTITGAPFIVYSALTCDTVGLANRGADAIKKALYDQLVAGEQTAVENAFSTQAFGQGPGLGGNPNVVNLGTAAGPVQAIGILENWLYARYGLPGVIHVPMLAAPYFPGSHAVALDGANPLTSVWRTEVGTAVSFGNYAGTGPTGQAGNWVYITGQVAVWRTPDAELFVPDFTAVINRSTNVMTMVMEREYVVTFDCYIAAVNVTLTDTSH